MKYMSYERNMCDVMDVEIYEDSEEEFIETISLLLILRRKRKRRRDEKNKRTRQKHRFWVRDIFKLREEYGEYHRLVQELREGDREYFFR